MVEVKAFYKGPDMPWDELLLSFVFQPTIVRDDWAAFKRTLFDGKQRFGGTLAGMFIFVFFLVFFQQARGTDVALALKKFYPQVTWARPAGADALRFVVQSVWLLVIQTKTAQRTISCYLNLFWRLCGFAKCIVLLPFAGISKTVSFIRNNIEFLAGIGSGQFAPKFYLYGIALLAMFCIVAPFDMPTQTAFILTLWLVAMTARAVGGESARLIPVALSLAVTARYLWWRYTSTLDVDSGSDLFLGVMLIGAETYMGLVLLLGFFQLVWPLRRQPASLPADPALWPSVDIFIPAYHDDFNLVKLTTLAALSIDWPGDRLNVYIIDGGKRPSIQEFAVQMGAGYIRREDGFDTKEAAINHALAATNGDYIAVFACGDVPVQSFLQLSMGCFLADEKLALIQAARGFYPLKNIYNEDNGLSVASFIGGSCLVLKRAPLLEVGGLAAGILAENARMTLRLHRKGYGSASINPIQVASLVPETLSAQIGRRQRWAYAMAQIFRLDKPLLWAGLSITQRLGYASAMLHLLDGIPRLIFLLAPLGFLLGHSHLIYAPAGEIVVYALPTVVLASTALSYLHGRRRYSMSGGVYETVLALYAIRPAIAGLLGLSLGSANATVKSGAFDLARSKPYLCLIGLNFLGAVFAGLRFFLGPADEQAMVLLYLAWVAYNLTFLGAALSATQENKRKLLQQRIPDSAEAIIKNASGRLIGAVLEDYSDSGLGLRINAKTATIEKNERIYVSIRRADREFVFPARVVNINQGALDVLLENLTLQQQRDYVQCTYAWTPKHHNNSQDEALSGLNAMVVASLQGYIVLARMSPKFITKPFLFLGAFLGFAKTLLPKNIKDEPIQHEHA